MIGELHKREQVFSHRLGLACHLQCDGHTFLQKEPDWFETCSPQLIGVKKVYKRKGRGVKSSLLDRLGPSVKNEGPMFPF